MKVLMTKHFSKWAKKHLLNKDDLREAALEIAAGNVEANLGHHLFKKRVATQGRSKQKAARVVTFYQLENKLIYFHGFMKNEKSTLSDKEFEAFKKLSDIFLALTEDQYARSIKNGDFEEVQTIAESVLSTVRDLHKSGTVKDITLREIETLCLSDIKPYSSKTIARLRHRLHLSQAAFARVLNISASTVQKWETGQKSPSGPALKLLTLADRKGLEAII